MNWCSLHSVCTTRGGHQGGKGNLYDMSAIDDILQNMLFVS